MIIKPKAERKNSVSETDYL